MPEMRAKTPTVIFFGYGPEMEELIEEQFEAGTRAINLGASSEESRFEPIFVQDVRVLATLVETVNPIAVIHELGKSEVKRYTNGSMVHEYSSVNTPEVSVIKLMRVIFAAARQL